MIPKNFIHKMVAVSVNTGSRSEHLVSPNSRNPQIIISTIQTGVRFGTGMGKTNRHGEWINNNASLGGQETKAGISHGWLFKIRNVHASGDQGGVTVYLGIRIKSTVRYTGC